MSRNVLAATVTAAVLLPISVGALLWAGPFRRRDVAVAFDPFEIDLQLTSRNDDE